MGLSLSPHLPPLHYLWLNNVQHSLEGRDDRNLQSHRDRPRGFLFQKHRWIRAKSLCVSLGEHSSLESLQTSVTKERLQSTSHTMPPCLTQQDLHASYWVVLCEERTPTPQEEQPFPSQGKTSSLTSRALLTLMGHPRHCLQGASQILPHTGVA